jgi:hypothetical protein
MHTSGEMHARASLQGPQVGAVASGNSRHAPTLSSVPSPFTSATSGWPASICSNAHSARSPHVSTGQSSGKQSAAHTAVPLALPTQSSLGAQSREVAHRAAGRFASSASSQSGKVVETASAGPTSSNNPTSGVPGDGSVVDSHAARAARNHKVQSHRVRGVVFKTPRGLISD